MLQYRALQGRQQGAGYAFRTGVPERRRSARSAIGAPESLRAPAARFAVSTQRSTNDAVIVPFDSVTSASYFAFAAASPGGG